MNPSKDQSVIFSMAVTNKLVKTDWCESDLGLQACSISCGEYYLAGLYFCYNLLFSCLPLFDASLFCCLPANYFGLHAVFFGCKPKDQPNVTSKMLNWLELPVLAVKAF